LTTSQIELAKTAAQTQLEKQYGGLEETPAQKLQKSLQTKKQSTLNKQVKVFGKNLQLPTDVSQIDQSQQ